MKKHFYLILSLFIAQSAFAQIGLDRIKNQAGNALGNAIDRKIETEMNKMADKAVNKYWDRVLGKYYQGAFEGADGKGGFPFILSDDVTTEANYNFTNNVVVKVDSYKKNGKLDNSMNMTMHFAGSDFYMGTQIEDGDAKKNKEEMFIVNDFKNKAMIILMNNNGEKMSMAYSLLIDEKALAEMTETEVENETPNLTYTKIGTKTIMGYTCQGYAYEDDDSKSEVWATDTDIYGIQSMFNMQKFGKDSPALPDGYPSGALMEVTSIDKKSNEKSVMQVVEINKSATLNIRMSDYPKINLGAQ